MHTLDLFHPLIKKWFTEKVGTPTAVQLSAWPLIAEKAHVLVSAPTGSGKTLAAFMWALDRLITRAWTAGRVRILYISPLKALNNDVRRNLLKPLFELERTFAEAGVLFPAIRVLTRSGDTPGDERQKMLKSPPEILITTPESLNILLTSKSGRSLLTGLQAVILDEIHAVVGSKRGTHLITAVDRLIRLSGEFQRIALSATVRPMDAVASFVGGYTASGTGEGIVYSPRTVKIIQSEEEKKYDLKVKYPVEYDKIGSVKDKESWWSALTVEFKQIINSHNSTLFFSNSRRMAEKITRFINETEEHELAYAHHGSLSREIRLAVEEKLKKGELKAIVATSSLELGIDIGELDQVVLIETPVSVSSAIQRIGRSGHDVGGTSRGALFPLHGRDFLNSAVMADAVLKQDIESVGPVMNPLDVLSQVILSMTSAEEWDVDELFEFIMTSYPYRYLSREYFNLVLDMLAGRFADSRIKELSPRVHLDRVENKIRAAKGAPYLLYLSGGTIPDRGYYNLRISGSKARIGELDEEFVWERRVGDTFAFGTQLWQIERITHNDVEVILSHDRQSMIPFWKAEEQNRSFYHSEKIAEFLENADSKLGDPDFSAVLEQKYHMQQDAAAALIDFLKTQKDVTQKSLPHRHHLLIEHFDDPFNRSDKKQVLLHTFWGGKINMPLAFALSAAWERTFHYTIQVMHTNDAILLMLPHEFRPADLFSMITHDNVENLLQSGLQDTGFFGARFRENAERALLLPKSAFRKRMPLWLNRLRSKKLLEAVSRYDRFPIVLETWRSCLEDEIDLNDLKNMLDEIQTGSIRISESVTHRASPFAEDLIWKETNKYMYEDDTPRGGKKAISDDLMAELLRSSHLRPLIPEELIGLLDSKLKRTTPRYAPGSHHELLDWVKERLLIPYTEWDDLLSSIEKDSPGKSGEFYEAIKTKLIRAELTGTPLPFVGALEMLPRLRQVFPELKTGTAPATKHSIGRDDIWSLADFLEQWLSYYGPVEIKRVQKILGITDADFNMAVEELAESGKITIDQFGEQSIQEEICTSANLEILLRMLRKSRRPAFQPLHLEKLSIFLAAFQGLAPRGESKEDMEHRLEQLFGWQDHAGVWEEYLLPSRMKPYFTAWLDSLMHTSDLIWFGNGPLKISLSFLQDIELFRATDNTDMDEADTLLPDPRGRFSFFDIVKMANLSTQETAEKIWSLVWKGKITSDSFQAIRKGILNRFSIPEPVHETIGRRSGFSRWQASKPMGYWYRIDSASGKKDKIEEEEIVKDRIRQLFRRYGILFRELLSRELPFMRWKNIFRILRLMEFSGEVLTGYFFEGIPGLQFISHEAYRMLQNPLPEEAVYWINAADPASLCGIDIDGIKSKLPPRLAGTFLVYDGSNPVLVLKRMGKSLEINVAPDHPQLQKYFEVFRDLLGREFNPVQRITVEKINGQAASASPFVQALRSFGFRSSGTAMELWK